ncbi:dephospho-CoA kinase [uncultured Flavobacterium sp.]|uniref:dephospho-CoA kinase n=1 Tax=uncultured Flavobacterium sp. TaxID=165435 RepID=UPI0030EB34E0|tara:strand:- start:43256 stop:43831 length:576 start_codon:yes stop_codon:yes gene_type:complete
MTKIIGLTGGIGSGKTTVANYLIEKNIPVYIADDEARKITNSKRVTSKIVELFGNQVLENDKINRAFLANIVFSDKEKLAQLNAIIHPEVKKHFKKWLKSKLDYKFVVKESAILFESGSYKDCDAIILVTAPLETRIERTMKRDNIARESVLQRINNQMAEEEKILKSDYVIQNISLKDTHIQLDQLLNYL